MISQFVQPMCDEETCVKCNKPPGTSFIPPCCPSTTQAFHIKGNSSTEATALHSISSAMLLDDWRLLCFAFVHCFCQKSLSCHTFSNLHELHQDRPFLGDEAAFHAGRVSFLASPMSAAMTWLACSGPISKLHQQISPHYLRLNIWIQWRRTAVKGIHFNQ